MQLRNLINDLQRILDKHGDCEVLIGATNYRFGGHTYTISDYMMAAKINEPEPEHTCELPDGNVASCICFDWDGIWQENNNCLLCTCPGCNTDDVIEPIVYLMEGDQNAYALPFELVSTEQL